MPIRIGLSAHRLMAISLMLVAASAAAQHPQTKLLPVVSGDEESRSTPFIAWIEDLSEQGYIEEEFSVAGSANIYSYIDDLNQSPAAGIMEADVPYVTRILVRRPDCKKPGKHGKGKHKQRKRCRAFNGTVYVEVLNATAGWDGDPIWQSNSEYIIREGAAWVGMSTKPVTVDFLRDTWGKAPFPIRNAERYADLSMPHFGQVWDMLTQMGALLKAKQAPGNPLRGYDVERLVMVGYSQSAAYQVTYANSFHHTAVTRHGEPVYDGYFISAGGARAQACDWPDRHDARKPAPGRCAKPDHRGCSSSTFSNSDRDRALSLISCSSVRGRLSQPPLLRDGRRSPCR